MSERKSGVNQPRDRNGRFLGFKKDGGIKGVNIEKDIRKQELNDIIEICSREIASREKVIPVDVSFDHTVLVSDVEVEHAGSLDIYHHFGFNVEDFAVKIAGFVFLLIASWYVYLKITELLMG